MSMTALQLLIQMMILSHEMGCRRSAIAFAPKMPIERIMAKCKEVSDVFEADLRRHNSEETK